MDHLNSLSPSAVDAEFRLLHLDLEYYELRLVIDFLTFHLDSNANFDVVQAYLNLFLKVLPLPTSTLRLANTLHHLPRFTEMYLRRTQPW